MGEFERPLKGKKNGVFLFVISHLVPEIFKLLQHQNIRHMAHFLVYNVLAKFQLFCIITCRDILYFAF